MSVLACDRRGCKNIMCDRVILEGTQYICYECMDELRDAKQGWLSTMTNLEVRESIENFMASTKTPKSVSLDKDGIDDEFKRLTGA